MALVEDRPLEDARSIQISQLAVDGPAICGAVARALGAHGELDERVSRVGELAGADSAAVVSAAVEALRAVVWSAVLRALPDADASLVAELAERLAVICERVREAALRRLDGAGAWPGRLESAVASARSAGSVLSVLLVEVEDASELEGLGTVVRGSIGNPRAEVHQAGGRVWVIGPGLDRGSAEELASAVASAVRGAGAPHGVPLRVSIGVATLDLDADDADGLIGAAEEATFAATARGIEIAHASAPVKPD